MSSPKMTKNLPGGETANFSEDFVGQFCAKLYGAVQEDKGSSKKGLQSYLLKWYERSIGV